MSVRGRVYKINSVNSEGERERKAAGKERKKRLSASAAAQ